MIPKGGMVFALLALLVVVAGIAYSSDQLRYAAIQSKTVLTAQAACSSNQASSGGAANRMCPEPDGVSTYYDTKRACGAVYDPVKCNGGTSAMAQPSAISQIAAGGVVAQSVLSACAKNKANCPCGETQASVVVQGKCAAPSKCQATGSISSDGAACAYTDTCTANCIPASAAGKQAYNQLSKEYAASSNPIQKVSDGPPLGNTTSNPLPTTSPPPPAVPASASAAPTQLPPSTAGPVPPVSSAPAAPPANSGILGSANQPLPTPVSSPILANQPPAITTGPAFNPQAGLPQAAPVPPAGTAALNTSPLIRPTVQQTFSGSSFSYGRTTGGVLLSPLTTFTSKVNPSALLSGISGFISGLLSSTGGYSEGGYSNAGGSQGSASTLNGVSASNGNSSNPNKSPNTLIIVVPAAGGTNAAGLVAQENFQKLLSLSKSGLPQINGQTSFASPLSIPAPNTGIGSATLGSSADIMSAYSVGSASSNTDFSGEADTQSSGVSSFPTLLNLSWATPTAVTVGVPVSLSAGTPASTVFNEFNANWVDTSSTLLQAQSALAQAQIDFDSTQAQISAWQQLQEAGLCGSDCLNSLAALESQGWQQQARVDALTKIVENGGQPAQQGGAPVATFGTAGTNPQYTGTSSVATTVSGPNGLPLRTSPTSGITQYASQPDNSPQGFDSGTSVPAAQPDNTSSGGLVGLPAILANLWQALTGLLQPAAPSPAAATATTSSATSSVSASSSVPATVEVTHCSLLGSLLGTCTGS